jgi:uncharacterized protein
MVSRRRKEEMNSWMRLIIFMVIWASASGCLYFIVTALFPEALNISKKEFENLIEKNFAFAFTIQFFMSLAVFLSIFIMLRFIEKKPLREIGLSFKFSEVLKGFGIGFCLITMFLFLLLILGFTELSFNRLSHSLPKYFILYFLVALMEETLSRGYILNNLLESTNKYIAVVLSSSLFGALHLLNNGISWIGYVNIVLFGMLAGLLYIKSNGLSMPVGLHLSWNFFQGSIWGFAVSGHSSEGLFANFLKGDPRITGGMFGAEGSLVVTFILVLVNLCLIIQGEIKHRQMLATIHRNDNLHH